MFIVTFIDKNHGGSTNEFDTFAEAQEFWDEYADTPSCIFGELKDIDTDEIIWQFDESEVE